MSNKNLIFFTRTMGLGGTENVILQLCQTLKSEVDKIVVCSSGGINVSRLDQLKIKHYTIPDIENKDFKTFLKTLKIINRIIKEENINIIHTHHRMAAFYSRILSVFNKFIFINTFHNTFENKRFLTRFSVKNANNIAVGNCVKENLVRFYGIQEDSIEVIYNAIKPFDDNLFREISTIKQYKEDGYFLVGNIGRLSKQKGMDCFIKAIPRILRENNKVKFFIIGTGEEEENLRNFINELELKNDVFLLGYRNDIQNTMKNLDLIVLSSLWEGLPLIPIEAFSVKRTIVATDVGGTKEVVKNGVNGVVVKKNNDYELAIGILDIVNNKEKREVLENNAYTTYNDKFSYDEFKRKYIKYYKDIIL